MQNVGSKVVNVAAGTHLPDAASGFRAYSRDALYRLNVVTQFSYCMETIIQAGNKRLRIASHPIAHVSEDAGIAALFEHLPAHVQVWDKGYYLIEAMFKPHVPLGWMAGIAEVYSVMPFIRFLIQTIQQGEGGGHVQLLI